MKKFLIASGIAALAFASVAAAQGYTFNTNLTVGSTGADVVALQTWLTHNGFSIPALAAGTAPGYFGSQTQAAVKGYQTSVGVPSTGFVGPLTRGKLNAGGGVPVASNGSTACPVGFTCTANTPTAVTCPVGFTCTANNGTTVNATGGTDGSLSVSQSAFVSTGASLKKGDTKNVVAVKLQATAGPVTVTRFDVHFSVRPWLFFSQAQLIDSTGKVIATKPIAGPTDSTEITVGSDYLVRFEGLNYVVAPGTNPDLAVGVTVLPATDKITNGMTVYAGVTTGAIRTVNGLGFTDSVGGTAFTGTSNPGGAGETSFTLSSTGSVADISTSISSASPASQVTVPVSATVTTNNVTLGWFSLKSGNNSSTVNNMKFTVTTSPGFAATEVFSNLRIMVGSQTYGALSFSDAGLATFTNLQIPLAQDQWTDVRLVADVAATTTNITTYSKLVANTIDATDSTYTAATVGGAAMAAATSDQTSVNTLLTINSVSLSNPVAVGTQAIVSVANGPVTAETVQYTFTLTNNSSNNMYVSSVAGTLINGTVASSTLGASGVSNASSTITTIEPMAAVAGDGTGYYILPTRGSRTFTVDGIIKQYGGSSLRTERLSISSIQYGNSTAGTGSNITTGIEKLTYAVTI
jgi:peptidoglycan hydrolase-like protein with peptidoglycan-binding domain